MKKTSLPSRGHRKHKDPEARTRGPVRGTTRGSGWLEYSVRKSGGKGGRTAGQEHHHVGPSKP